MRAMGRLFVVFGCVGLAVAGCGDQSDDANKKYDQGQCLNNVDCEDGERCVSRECVPLMAGGGSGGSGGGDSDAGAMDGG